MNYSAIRRASGLIILPLFAFTSLMMMASGIANTAPASVSLTLNSSSYVTNAALRLSVTTIPGNPANPVDVYIYLRLPNGSLLYMQADSSFSANAAASLSNIVIPALHSKTICNYHFSGHEPAGT